MRSTRSNIGVEGLMNIAFSDTREEFGLSAPTPARTPSTVGAFMQAPLATPAGRARDSPQTPGSERFALHEARHRRACEITGVAYQPPTLVETDPAARRGPKDKKQATNRRRVNMKYHMGRRLTVPPRLKEAQQKKIVSAYLAFEMDDDALRAHLPGGAADVGPTPARLARGFSFGADDEDPELLALAEEALGPEVGDGGGAAAPAAAPLPLVTPGRRTPPRAARSRPRERFVPGPDPRYARSKTPPPPPPTPAAAAKPAASLQPAFCIFEDVLPPAEADAPARPASAAGTVENVDPNPQAAAIAAALAEKLLGGGGGDGAASPDLIGLGEGLGDDLETLVDGIYGELESDDAKTSDDDGFGLECTETLPVYLLNEEALAPPVAASASPKPLFRFAPPAALAP